MSDQLRRTTKAWLLVYIGAAIIFAGVAIMIAFPQVKALLIILGVGVVVVLYGQYRARRAR